MKINELLINIKNKNFNLEKELKVVKYLPIEVKKTIAQSIIYDCTTEENGVVKVDSVERYMSYVRNMIVMHTNLEYTDEDYDVLCSTEYGDGTLLSEIIECFGSDAQECSRILELMTDDYMQEQSIEFGVVKFLNDLTMSIKNITDKIAQKTDELKISDNIDMDKLGAFLQNYIK